MIEPAVHHELLLHLSNPDFADRYNLVGKRVGNSLNLYAQRKCFFFSLFTADHEYVRAAEYLSKVIPASIEYINMTEDLNLKNIRNNLSMLRDRMSRKAKKQQPSILKDMGKAIIAILNFQLNIQPTDKKSALKTDGAPKSEKKVKFNRNASLVPFIRGSPISKKFALSKKSEEFPPISEIEKDGKNWYAEQEREIQLRRAKSREANLNS